MQPLKRLFLVTGFCCLTSLTSGCSSAPPLSPWETPPSTDKIEERVVEAMGTRFHIRLWKEGADAGSRNRAFLAATSEIKRVAALVDSDNPKSELSLLNVRARKASVRVSPELMSLIKLGLQMSVRSNGVFDITFARLQDETEKYGQDTGLTSGVNEAAADVGKALKTSVGSANLVIDFKTSQVRFAKTGVKVGLLGLAKGYAAQKAADKILAAHVPGFAVLGGGMLAAAGKALTDEHLMCVEHPNALGTCAYKILPKNMTSVAYFAASAVEERPGHIYNAKNGQRKAREGGVTVAAADGASAQAGAVAGAAMDNKTTLQFFSSPLPPKMSGVFFGSDIEVTLFGSLEPFAKTAPIPHVAD